MGVMECDRTCCTNTMCTMYSTMFGYICSECYQKLVEFLERTDGNIVSLTKIFMSADDSSLQLDNGRSDIVEEWLDKEFKNVYK